MNANIILLLNNNVIIILIPENKINFLIDLKIYVFLLRLIIEL